MELTYKDVKAFQDRNFHESITEYQFDTLIKVYFIRGIIAKASLDDFKEHRQQFDGFKILKDLAQGNRLACLFLAGTDKKKVIYFEWTHTNVLLAPKEQDLEAFQIKSDTETINFFNRDMVFYYSVEAAGSSKGMWLSKPFDKYGEMLERKIFAVTSSDAHRNQPIIR